jgi:hypothetical protein
MAAGSATGSPEANRARVAGRSGCLNRSPLDAQTFVIEQWDVSLRGWLRRESAQFELFV